MQTLRNLCLKVLCRRAMRRGPGRLYSFQQRTTAPITAYSPSVRSAPSLGPSTTTPQKKARFVCVGMDRLDGPSSELSGTTLRGDELMGIVKRDRERNVEAQPPLQPTLEDQK